LHWPQPYPNEVLQRIVLEEGGFRGNLVRYVFMAQELSQQAEKVLGPIRQGVDAPIEVSRQATQDLDLLGLWAEDNSDRVAKRTGLDKR
jgi:hypothetical protein